MKQTDINRYAGSPDPNRQNNGSAAGATAATVTKRVLAVLTKTLLTVFMVCVVTGCIIGVSMLVFIAGFADETVTTI